MCMMRKIYKDLLFAAIRNAVSMLAGTHSNGVTLSTVTMDGRDAICYGGGMVLRLPVAASVAASVAGMKWGD